MMYLHCRAQTQIPGYPCQKWDNDNWVSGSESQSESESVQWEQFLYSAMQPSDSESESGWVIEFVFRNVNKPLCSTHTDTFAWLRIQHVSVVADTLERPFDVSTVSNQSTSTQKRIFITLWNICGEKASLVNSSRNAKFNKEITKEHKVDSKKPPLLSGWIIASLLWQHHSRKFFFKILNCHLIWGIWHQIPTI